MTLFALWLSLTATGFALALGLAIGQRRGYCQGYQAGFEDAEEAFDYTGFPVEKPGDSSFIHPPYREEDEMKAEMIPETSMKGDEYS